MTPPMASLISTRGLAVKRQQLIAYHAAKPQEKGKRRVAEVIVAVLGRGQERFLHDVGGVDPPVEPAVEPERDHAAHARLVLDEQCTPSAGVARRRLTH